tara:strand:- start:1072 stop:1188 length:117 start_codon:yes stop_codon:yes gene_type:complete
MKNKNFSWMMISLAEKQNNYFAILTLQHNNHSGKQLIW